MQIRTSILFLFLFCFACNNTSKEESDAVTDETTKEIEFDRTKWSTKEGLDYPFRDQMLTDIVYNDAVRELYKDEVIDLLGEPDRIDSLYLFYTVAQKRIFLFPLHTKTLVIKLYEDETIDWIKIHE